MDEIPNKKRKRTVADILPALPCRPRHKCKHFPDGQFNCDDGANIDPEEWDFVNALDRYKRENCRPFVTGREVLAVLKSRGYRKIAPAGPLPKPPTGGPKL